jgi:hypothetical protein
MDQEQQKSSKKTVIIVVVVLVVLVLIIILATGKNKAQSPSTTGSNNQTVQPLANSQKAPSVSLTTIDVPAPTTPYTATADNFSVNFAKAPKLSSTRFNSFSSGMIPVTEYKEQFAKDAEMAYYQVGVYHYPTTYQFPDGILTTALQAATMIASARYPGSKIDNQSSTTLLGNPAEAALVTVPMNVDPKNPTTKVTTGDYLLITTKDHNIYVISAYGMTQSNYDAFVNSFKFTN